MADRYSGSFILARWRASCSVIVSGALELSEVRVICAKQRVVVPNRAKMGMHAKTHRPKWDGRNGPEMQFLRRRFTMNLALPFFRVRGRKYLSLGAMTLSCLRPTLDLPVWRHRNASLSTGQPDIQTQAETFRPRPIWDGERLARAF